MKRAAKKPIRSYTNKKFFKNKIYQKGFLKEIKPSRCIKKKTTINMK